LAVEAEMQRRTGKTIKEFQRVGIRHLGLRRAAALLDDPGLGKTIQAIGALPAGCPVLIVCPNGVKGKWAKELRKWRPGWRIVVLGEGMPFRWPQPGEAIIVNYERLPPAHAERESLRSRMTASRVETFELEVRYWKVQKARRGLTRPAPGTVAVVDEAHRAKDRDAKVTHRWRELAALLLATDVYACGGRVWLLTGTPLVNRRDELYTVLQAAGLGEALFGDLTRFRAACDSGDVADRLKLACLRRLREHVLPELPPVEYEDIPVAIDATTRRYCDKIVQLLSRRGVSMRGSSFEQLSAVAGPGGELAGAISSVRERLARLKVPTLAERIDDAEADETPLLVYSAHRAPVDYAGARRNWTSLTEGPEENTRRGEAFQTGKFFGCASTYQAGGEGIDLYRAWRMIRVDEPWTPKAVEQSEGRMQRIGQTSTRLLVTRLVADHVLERRVNELLDDKRAEIAASVDAAAEPPPLVSG